MQTRHVINPATKKPYNRIEAIKKMRHDLDIIKWEEKQPVKKPSVWDRTRIRSIDAWDSDISNK